MTKRFHLRADIRGMLLQPNSALTGVLQDDEGKALSPREAKVHLMNELQGGALFVPCAPCDNWSKTDGCQGHDVD